MAIGSSIFVPCINTDAAIKQVNKKFGGTLLAHSVIKFDRQHWSPLLMLCLHAADLTIEGTKICRSP